MDVRIGITIVVSLAFCIIWSVFTGIYYKKRLIKWQKEMEQKNQNLRLQLFTSQIRPHFILNTLGAIRSMVREDSERAYDLLYDFSKYIRSNIEEKDYSKPIPFLEEMDYVDTYLKLEQLRFGDKIKVEKDFETSEFWVLPLTIQPFVENAVKHGLMESKKGGTIWIRSRKAGDRVCVEIEDNGVGFDVDKMYKDKDSGKAVGMKSAMYRIQYNLDGICQVTSSQKPGESGTTVHIELPVKRGA